MIGTRRDVLAVGGGLAAALAVRPAVAAPTAEMVTISMRGRADGSRVWFDPIGVLIKPGQTVRWVNVDKGNSHTSTAYSPEVLDRPLRIPRGANARNSDYLLPNETFSVTFIENGVYDYYCIPHEQVGMVGRIVVGGPEAPGWMDASDVKGDLPEDALANFPPVDRIIANGIVRGS